MAFHVGRNRRVEDGLPGRTREFRLGDGRILGIAEFGDSSGFPVLAFHGIPGSRLTFAFADVAARRLRLRLICPERPGIGRSSPSPGRTLVDWADDMAQLVDQLRLPGFGVVGLSGGGPYALAVTHRLQLQVVVAAVVSGMGPVDDPWVLRQISWRQRMRLHLFRDLPGFVPLLASAAGFGLKHLSEGHLIRILALVPEPGRKILNEIEAAPFVFEPLREGFRQGAGSVRRDLQLMTRPWGFRIEEIRNPVLLWHGVDDFDVPVLLARAVARRLPDCRPRFINGAGHLWILNHVEEVLSGMARAVEGTETREG